MIRPRNPTRKKNHHSAGATRRRSLWQRLLTQSEMELRELSLNPANFKGPTPWEMRTDAPEQTNAWLAKRHEEVQAALRLLAPTKE